MLGVMVLLMMACGGGTTWDRLTGQHVKIHKSSAGVSFQGKKSRWRLDVCVCVCVCVCVSCIIVGLDSHCLINSSSQWGVLKLSPTACDVIDQCGRTLGERRAQMVLRKCSDLLFRFLQYSVLKRSLSRVKLNLDDFISRFTGNCSWLSFQRFWAWKSPERREEDETVSSQTSLLTCSDFTSHTAAGTSDVKQASILELKMSPVSLMAARSRWWRDTHKKSAWNCSRVIISSRVVLLGPTCRVRTLNKEVRG